MTEKEDKVILEQLREGKILEENIINDVYRMYLQLQKAGDSVNLVDVFVNRGFLSKDQTQKLFNQSSTKSLQKIGDYNIVKKLGAGGMGSVFLVQKDEKSPLLALKVLSKSSSQNEKAVSRFNREFRALQQLKHPRIISGIEKGFSGGYHFYVMEYFEGQNLKAYCEMNKPLNFKKAVEIIREIAIGLQYAISKGMIHRDIKPDNIIITNLGEVKIIDFGLVKIENEDSMSLTKTQTAMGTPHFISCEQAKNAKEADLRSDIYSLGATLFYMVTNEYPVKGTTAYEVLAALISGQVEKPNIANPLIPLALNQLILNMMGMAVEDRYQNYEELLIDIELFLNGGKIKPLIKGPSISSKINTSKKKILMIALAAFILVGIVVFKFANSNMQPPVVVPEKLVNKVEDPDEGKETVIESTKEILTKYKIVSSFDREDKRVNSMRDLKSTNEKLDEFLNWLSRHEIDEKDEKGSFEEKLLTRAFTLLAFCGAGYDFYQGQDLKMMEKYLKFITDSQIEPGKWSSDIWINAICTNAIIESFAMYGSDNKFLAKLSNDSLKQLSLQFKEFRFIPVDQNILGAHFYLTAFTLSRIASLPQLDFILKREQIENVRKSIWAKALTLRANSKSSLLDKLDLEVVSQIVGRFRDNDLFIKQIEIQNVKPTSCREAYFMMLLYGISHDKVEKKWLLENSRSYLESDFVLKNEISKYSEKSGLIVTYAIAALAIENIYRIPPNAIMQKKEFKGEGKLREIIENKK